MFSCDNIYETNTTFKKSGAAIGYGKRFGDLINKSVAPSP